MEAVSRAFVQVPGRSGCVVGVLPGSVQGDGAPPGYPNPWIEIPIRTHLPLRGDPGEDPLSRNHINVLTSDVIVALPGGGGTLSEVRLALEYGTPVVAHLSDPAELNGLPEAVPLEPEVEGVLDFIREALWKR